MEPAASESVLVVEIDPEEAHSPEAAPMRAFECRVVGHEPGFDD
jgi:hypothetical protein